MFLTDDACDYWLRNISLKVLYAAPQPVTAQQQNDWKRLRDRDPRVAGMPVSVQQAMARRIFKISFDAITVAECIGKVEVLMGIKIKVEWDSLQTAGITREKRVTATLEDVRADKVIQVILNAASDTPTQLGYVINSDREMYISTLSVLQRDYPNRPKILIKVGTCAWQPTHPFRVTTSQRLGIHAGDLPLP